MSIATNLKHWRQVRGLTQPELAEKAEIEQSYLSKLENDRSKPSDAVLERLSAALGIDADTLLKDPSRNGQVKKALITVFAALVLLGAGFAGGYFFSGYEVRKVGTASENLNDVYSLAPQGLSIESMASLGGESHPFEMFRGHFENPGDVRVFAARLLAKGTYGGALQSLRIDSDKKEYVLEIRDAIESKTADQ